MTHWYFQRQKEKESGFWQNFYLCMNCETDWIEEHPAKIMPRPCPVCSVVVEPVDSKMIENEEEEED